MQRIPYDRGPWFPATATGQSSSHAFCKWPMGGRGTWANTGAVLIYRVRWVGACFGTGSEAVPWGHVNEPSERRIRPAFLQPRALDGTALTIGPSKNCPVTAIYWAGVGQWRHSWRSASVHRPPTLKRTHIANCALWVVPTSATEREFPMLIQW